MAADSTVLERIAGSTVLDGWGALIAVVVVVAQVTGLVFGVDMLDSLPAEWVIGVFGVGAWARRKIANGRGVQSALERSHADLAIPQIIDPETTAPMDMPENLRDRPDAEGDG